MRVVLVGVCVAVLAVASASAATRADNAAVTSTALLGGYSPAWSPDGSQIAFIGPARRWVISQKTSTLTETPGANRVFVVNSDGSMPSHLVSVAPRDEILEEVRWAAGGWFVYQDSNYTLWADTGTRGKHARLLGTVGVSGGDAFSLSRDGSLVAFTAPCNCAVAQGTEVGVVSASGGKARILPHRDAIDSHPSFTPDGKEIIFSRVRVGKNAPPWPHNQSIVVEAVRGGSARSLHVNGDWPVVSPDRRWLAFKSTSPSPGGALEMIPVTGGRPRLLVPRPKGTVVGPFAWSPDSTRLVFEDGARIGTVDLQRKTTLFALPGLRPGLGTPQWSPDGTSIAFSAIKKSSGTGADLDTRVYVINADGSGLRRVS